MDTESGNEPVNWFPLTEIVCMLVSVHVLAGRGPERRRPSRLKHFRFDRGEIKCGKGLVMFLRLIKLSISKYWTLASDRKIMPARKIRNSNFDIHQNFVIVFVKIVCSIGKQNVSIYVNLYVTHE